MENCFLWSLKGNKKVQNTIWYGMGPGENYADSHAAAAMGIYRSRVDAMGCSYVYPQENGHRESVKWFAIGGEELTEARKRIKN